MQNGRDSRVSEPGELVERKKQFLVLDEEPKPMDRDVGDFNARSADAKRF
jgi:hypothetical protein